MLKNIFLPSIFLLLGYGFWLSTEFKTITAGVAIFLFGMLAMEEGFRTFTGGALEKILKASTDRLWKSLSFGILTTSIMQSSSLVSVITISFLSAGLLDLVSAIGIIFGANLGTTTGAWLVAGLGLKVNLATYAMPMLVFGIILIFQTPRNLKGAGYVLAGLGFLFLGIHYMKEGFDAFGQGIDLSRYSLTGYTGVLAFAGIGIVATVVMQSSHATLVLILAALSVQQISYENALALAIGSNVGTTVTAVLGAIGASVNGKRLAAAHFIFNFITGLVAVIFIFQLMAAVAWISALIGIASDNYTLQLAVFHTLFNVIGVVIMLPLINRLVALLERILPAPVIEIERPLYLSDASREMADAALEAVRKETLRLYDLAVGIINDGLSIRRDLYLSEEKPKRVVKQSTDVIEGDIDDLYERKLKALYGAIIEFTVKIKGGYTGGVLKQELNELRQAGQSVIEAVKGVKHLKKNLTRYMRSDNPYIKKEYDRLRRLVVKVMRRIDDCRQEESSAEPEQFARIRNDVNEKMDSISAELDGLIREGHINAHMATSFMNDSSYCRNICEDLVHAGEVLFSNFRPEVITATDPAAQTS